jgi:hypothetical protein
MCEPSFDEQADGNRKEPVRRPDPTVNVFRFEKRLDRLRAAEAGEAAKIKELPWGRRKGFLPGGQIGGTRVLFLGIQGLVGIDCGSLSDRTETHRVPDIMFWRGLTDRRSAARRP